MKITLFALIIFSIPIVLGQCPTIAPTGKDSCRIGSGSVVLEASGSTNFYSWYDAPIGGNFLGSDSPFNTPSISSSTDFYVAAADTNRGLNFDGGNDYVAISNYNYSAAGIQEVTVECWIRTADGTDQMIASYDRSEYWRLEINGSGAGTGQVGWDVRTNAGQLDFGSSSRVDDGEWHHIAAVYDNGTVSIYIDGVLDASTNRGTAFGTGLTRFGFISAGSEATFFNGTNTPFIPFNGDIEDFRIWSVARSALEIQADMNKCLIGTETGLDVYLPMEDGVGTAVTDLVGSSDGTMFNMNPATDWIIADRAYFCSSCESARTTVTASVSSGAGVNLGPDYFSSCGGTAITLDAGSGFTNYMWNTGAITQTIDVSIAGEYSVIVDNGGGCFDFDTIVISESPFGGIPLSPMANDTCRIGSGSIGVRATGSTGVYNWYDASSGGAFLDTGEVYQTPVIVSSTTYYVAAKEQNGGLNFDGTNDYVALNSSYSSSGITEVTVEAWVRTSATGAQIIASYDRSDYWRLGIASTGGSAGQVTWSLGTNAGILDLASTGTVNDGIWHHVVGVYDNGTARIYIDGAADGVGVRGTSIGTGLTRFGFIGTGSETASFNGTQTVSRFQGDIDELVIWNVAKTPAQIAAGKDVCIDGDIEGLFAYYSFQDGAGTTLTDVFAGQNGTMFNMVPTSDWIDADYPFSCESCESARTSVTVSIGGGAPLNLGPDLDLSCVFSVALNAGSGYTSYTWSNGETTPSISVSLPGSYSVVVDDGSGCVDLDTVIVEGLTGSSQTALNFDGANDYVAIPNFFYQSTTITEITVEAWIRTTNGGDQIIASFDRSDYWRLGINGDGAGTGQISWNLLTNAGILDFGSSTRIDDGLWHHVTAIYNNGTATIYIDGVLDTQQTRGVRIGTGNVRFGFIGTGSEATSFNGARGPTNEMNGDIDQLRIWNRAKTINEVRTDMCLTNPVNNSGLELSYNFNDGSGTEVSESVAGNNGTMFNMAPASDWIVSGAAIGDASVFLYPVSWAGQTLALNSCSGDEVEISNVSGSSAGIHLYIVQGDPNALTGINNFTSGNYYFGVFQTNDNLESYDAQYTYTGHPLVALSNENSLVLLDRDDNRDNTWSDNGSNLNIVTDVINAGFLGRKEFILDYSEFIWTGNTNTNWAIGGNWLPASVPTVNANIRIPDVVNQPILDIDRQAGSFTIETGATVDLNSTEFSISRDLQHDGELLFNSGKLTLNSTNGDQRIIANSAITANDIESANPANVSIENGRIDLEGSLDISAGTFNTNDSLIVISNALGTGRIGEITGISITGEIEMQRHIDAGETYWRYFSSAVQGATIGQYNDDFITAGYPGSAFPNFEDFSGQLWPSVYTYNETLGVGLGYIPASGTGQVIEVGEGLQVWCGDTITGTTPFQVDLRGSVNQGDISLPVSFTFTGTPEEDGFCLVGNPYPSTIDWDSPNWMKTANIANAIYIQDPDTRLYASYVAGASTNGGSRNIASQQAFWVQVTNAAPLPALRASEAVKSTIDASFFKSISTYSPGMTISLIGDDLQDECVLRHIDESSEGFDIKFDAKEYFGGWGTHPQISLVNDEGKDFSIQSFNRSHQEWSIPVRVVVFESGKYFLNFSNGAEIDAPCLKLEDRYTGEVMDVTGDAGFEIELSDTTYAPRFILHVGKNVERSVIPPTCNGETDGQIILGLGVDQELHYSFTKDNEPISMTSSSANPLVLNDLGTGIYSLEIPNYVSLCGIKNYKFAVIEPKEIQIEADITNDYKNNNGSIVLDVSGGTPPYFYTWNFGAESSDVKNLGEGIYTVNVSDSKGCEQNKDFEVLNILDVEDYKDKMRIWFDDDERFIFIENGKDLTDLSIIGADGRLIEEVNQKLSENLLQIAIPANLSSGVYFLKNGTSTLSFKFFVSN